MLTNEKLVQLIQGGILSTTHLEQLYTQNIKLINYIIKHTIGFNSDLSEELTQEAYFILCNCVQHFDLKQSEIKFSTYFAKAFQFGIYRYCIENNSVKAPPYIMSLVSKYKKLSQSGISEREILSTLKINLQQLDLIKIASRRPLSIDTPIACTDNEKLTIADKLVDNTATFEDTVINKVDCGILLKLCKQILTSNEFQLVKYRYWFQLPYTKIAEIMNLSYNSVTHIKLNARRKLRRNKRIQAYYNGYLCQHVGLNEFKATHTSEVEKTALRHLEYSELASKL